MKAMMCVKCKSNIREENGMVVCDCTNYRTAKMKVEIEGPSGVKLILDSNEINHDDPGQGTPVIVEFEGMTSTYNCAIGTGVVESGSKYADIPKDALEWMESDDIVAEIERMYDCDDSGYWMSAYDF